MRYVTLAAVRRHSSIALARHYGCPVVTHRGQRVVVIPYNYSDAEAVHVARRLLGYY